MGINISSLILMLCAHFSYARKNNTSGKQECINLSKQKWNWMADMNRFLQNVYYCL
jgi:hypothetical protein